MNNLARVEKMEDGKFAVLCPIHGEQHNNWIVREGVHISNTILLVSNDTSWLLRACEKHNKEMHS